MLNYTFNSTSQNAFEHKMYLEQPNLGYHDAPPGLQVHIASRSSLPRSSKLFIMLVLF